MILLRLIEAGEILSIMHLSPRSCHCSYWSISACLFTEQRLAVEIFELYNQQGYYDIRTGLVLTVDSVIVN